MLDKKLIERIKSDYGMNIDGTHGIRHWGRVLENGRKIAETNGANMVVVELFAVLHDSHRRTEHFDPYHGKRAAEYVSKLRGELIHLADDAFRLLCQACRGHTANPPCHDVTVRTCRDADRLDIGRVGKRISERYLFSDIAKNPNFLKEAYDRSIQGDVSLEIMEELGIS